MKIIWIRHGKVDYFKEGDKLNEQGKIFVENLPKILAENNLIPNLVFYDFKKRKKDGTPIQRCRETILGLNCPEKISYDSNKELDWIFKKCKKEKVAVICYTSESLENFAIYKGPLHDKFTGNDKLAKEDIKKDIDGLYQKILIKNLEGENLGQININQIGNKWKTEWE